MANKRDSLLEKYNIPISHLDFDYIKKCNNCKEVERIFRILNSGDEGYYPNLTECAEERLKELKPESKWLRTENKIQNKKDIDKNHWTEISDPFVKWSDEVKIKDKFLSTISESKNTTKDEDIQILPPIRGKNIKIDLKNDKNNKNKTSNSTSNTKESNSNRIQSIDYQKWDKYDADVEVLKIELEEERIKQESESIKNLKIREEKNKYNDWKIDLDKLTNVEKESLAMRYKETGNDYYRAGEYENAIKEYTKTIRIFPSAVGYNNRAMTYLKLKKYEKCIEDCDSCLQFTSNNLKALFRKGQAMIELNRKNEAYEIYSKILSLEPSNMMAKNILNSLKASTVKSSPLSTLPPPNATRIKIEEKSLSPKTTPHKQSNTNQINDDNTKIHKSSQSKIVDNVNSSDSKQVPIPSLATTTTNRKTTTITTQNKLSTDKSENDLSKLIIPKKIIKSKLVKAVENMNNMKKINDSKKIQINNENSRKSKIQTDFKLNLLTTDNKNHKEKNNILINEM